MSQDALIVFSRYPRLGRVKTRLQPVLGVEVCLKLHTALLLDTIHRIASLASAEKATLHLYLAECSAQELQSLLARHDLPSTIRLHQQAGKDLGERLWNACQAVFRESPRIVLLGSDSPSLPLDYIRQARTDLLDFPVVMGPSFDGGYYLLGLSQPRQDIFRGITWGTSTVLEKTLAKLQKEEYRLLPGWYDVDTLADLERLRADLQSVFEGFPELTHQVLKELAATPF